MPAYNVTFRVHRLGHNHAEVDAVLATDHDSEEVVFGCVIA